MNSDFEIPDEEIDESIPQHFEAAGTHGGRAVCFACMGMRLDKDGEHPCIVCEGKGGYDLGCGGMVEKDLHYNVRYCQGCKRFISESEVTQA